MSPEVKIAFSREVPRGACVVGVEREGLKYDPVAITDSQSTDLFSLGIARKLLNEGKNVIFVFGSEGEMKENVNKIAKAFENYG